MDEPDSELVREVFAHFGLCLYLSQVVETGIINILTALETACSSQPTRQTFDAFYEKHEALTFGNLLKELKRHDFFAESLEKDVRQMKSSRDHLAHRFFREHDVDFITPSGCRHMIEVMQQHQDRFDGLNKEIAAVQADAYAKAGLDIENFEIEVEEVIDELKTEARKKWGYE